MSAQYRRLIARLSEAQNHRCAYCSVRFGAVIYFGRNHWWEPPWTLATVDHFIPRSQGGSYQWANLLAACKRCNELRGDEDAMSFFLRRGWISHGREAQSDRRGHPARVIRRAEPVDHRLRVPRRAQPRKMPKRRRQPDPPRPPGTARPFADFFAP